MGIDPLSLLVLSLRLVTRVHPLFWKSWEGILPLNELTAKLTDTRAFIVAGKGGGEEKES